MLIGVWAWRLEHRLYWTQATAARPPQRFSWDTLKMACSELRDPGETVRQLRLVYRGHVRNYSGRRGQNAITLCRLSRRDEMVLGLTREVPLAQCDYIYQKGHGLLVGSRKVW